MTRDEIEADLAEDFDLEQLAVYGDFLQAEGDPRGELIAIELNQMAMPERRDELLAQWLGTRLAELLGRDRVELGFCDLHLGTSVESRDLLDTWVATPAAHYARTATITGPSMWIKRAALAVATCSGRWLEQLSIRLEGEGPLDDELARSVMDAAPNLERLEVWGTRVFREIGHSRVRSLRVTGFDAVGSILDAGDARFPKLAMLDLAFDRDAVDPDRLRAARLPALRRLDLSSNEPGRFGPHNFGGRADPFWVLGALELRDQLVAVRLPSVRSVAQAEQLSWALARMPLLREATLARTYHEYRFFTPERVKAPAPYPWPPADLAELQVTIHVDQAGLQAAPLIGWLEASFDQLPVTARTAWLRMFELMRQQETMVVLPPALLRDGLAPFASDGDPGLEAWTELRDVVASGREPRVLATVRTQ